MNLQKYKTLLHYRYMKADLQDDDEDLDEILLPVAA